MTRGVFLWGSKLLRVMHTTSGWQRDTSKSCDSRSNKSLFRGAPGRLGQCWCLLLRALERHLPQHRGISGQPAPWAANSPSSFTSFNPADSHINCRIVFYSVPFLPLSGEKCSGSGSPVKKEQHFFWKKIFLVFLLTSLEEQQTEKQKGCSRTTRCERPTSSFIPSSFPLLSVEGRKQAGMLKKNSRSGRRMCTTDVYSVPKEPDWTFPEGHNQKALCAGDGSSVLRFAPPRKKSKEHQLHINTHKKVFPSSALNTIRLQRALFSTNWKCFLNRIDPPFNPHPLTLFLFPTPFFYYYYYLKKKMRQLHLASNVKLTS